MYKMWWFFFCLLVKFVFRKNQGRKRDSEEVCLDYFEKDCNAAFVDEKTSMM